MRYSLAILGVVGMSLLGACAKEGISSYEPFTKPLGPKHDFATLLEPMPSGKPTLAYDQATSARIGKPSGSYSQSIGRAPANAVDRDAPEWETGDWGYGIVSGPDHGPAAVAGDAATEPSARQNVEVNITVQPATPGGAGSSAVTPGAAVDATSGGGGTTVVVGGGAPSVADDTAAGYGPRRSESLTGAETDTAQREGSTVGTGAGGGGLTGGGRNSVGADWEAPSQTGRTPSGTTTQRNARAGQSSASTTGTSSSRPPLPPVGTVRTTPSSPSQPSRR